MIDAEHRAPIGIGGWGSTGVCVHVPCEVEPGSRSPACYWLPAVETVGFVGPMMLINSSHRDATIDDVSLRHLDDGLILVGWVLT